MIKKIENNQDPNFLRIEYMLGNICNYKCHYCFPGSNEGNELWPEDIELVKQNLKHLLKHYELNGKNKINLFFTGGEPTLWKGLEEICIFLKDNFDVITEIYTNGTRKIKWWKENAKHFDHISMSVHREFANIPHLIEVCDILYEQGVFVNADLLMDPFAFDQCLEILEELKSSKYNWPIIAKVVHFDGMHKYSEEQLSFFNDCIKRYPSVEWYVNTTKKKRTHVKITKDNDDIIETSSDSWITRNNLNHFKGWECNLGVDILKIYPNGRITGGCLQSILGEQNLYNKNFIEDFAPKIEPVICTKEICGCNGEIICNKRKI